MQIRLTRVLMVMLAAAAVSVAPALVANDKDRAARQQELDAACEAARARRLSADRQRLIAECMSGTQRSQEDCAAEYSNYGERAGSRPPLYYDLPECEAAIDFQKSTRSTR